ncbi:MAG: zf-TFIIB domain-containing protein [Candidatus Eremiobacteraeota bacterium]|nr:zf-TFIIB domain-containing protein [Candidatus Eremiobacteraeota bacterium]
MKCPRCKNEMNPVTIQYIEVNMCPACEGVWFDSGELNRVIHMGEAEIEKSELAPSLHSDITYDEKPSLREFPCPRCGDLMMRYYYGAISDIVIDGCQQGCGVFLDDGELKRILVHLIGEEKTLSPEDEAFMQELMKELHDDYEKEEVKSTTMDTIEIMDKKSGRKNYSGKFLQLIHKILSRIVM